MIRVANKNTSLVLQVTVPRLFCNILDYAYLTCIFFIFCLTVSFARFETNEQTYSLVVHQIIFNRLTFNGRFIILL